MIAKWYDRWCGKIDFPRYLVRYCTRDLTFRSDVRTIAGSITISRQLFLDIQSRGNTETHRRWPSSDEVIMEQIARSYLKGFSIGGKP